MKPLVVFDIETTGNNKFGDDSIIQFSAIKVDRETNKMIDSINEYIQPEGNYVMSIGAYLAHHIHPDFLKDKPKFKDLAQRIREFFNGCDILTFNGISFDLPILMCEFKKCGIDFHPSDFVQYDSYLTEYRRNCNKLVNLFEKYCGRTMEEAGLQPHDGMSDVKALYAVFRHQNEIEEVVPEILITDDNILKCEEFEGKETIVLNTSKYKGIPLSYICIIDRPYLQWLLGTRICKKTKDIISKELNNEQTQQLS